MRTLFVLLVSLAAATGWAGPLPDKPHIYVEGSAELRVPPDQMAITIGLEETHQELANAKEAVDERSRRLIAACKKLGIDPDDLSTSALHISPAYDYMRGERVPLGSRVYRQVDITLRDLSKYTEFMAALVNAEISNIVSTELEVEDEKALRDKVMQTALEDARQRADAMAKATGKKLGQPWSVSEFDLRRDDRPYMVVSRGFKSMDASAEMAARSDAEPFEPGLIVTEAKVYVVFLLR